MEFPLVSVVIPVYNAGLFVHNAVESVLAQTMQQFELIIVDDGSSDSTPILLKAFAENDPRIRVISIPHSGVSHAMNRGMNEAKGKYIARMDADDEMYAERLRRQLEFLEENKSTGVVSCLVKHGGDPEKQEGYGIHINWINTLRSPEEIALNRFVDSPVCNPSVMFRKELVAKFGGCKDGDFPEDYEMWLRWMEHGVQFAKVNEELLKWNDPVTRLTRNDERYSPEAFNRIKSGYLGRFIKERIGKRQLWLCGAGRITRKKSEFLAQHDLPIGGYIDVDPSRIGKEFNGLPVIGLDQLKTNLECYVVSYVGNRGARTEIRKVLLSRNFAEGQDFVMAG